MCFLFSKNHSLHCTSPTEALYICTLMANDNKLAAIIAHCKEYGFIFQSSELYDGLSAVYDYGQMGVELKKNIRETWWRSMVYGNENIVGLDSAIFMHPTIWKASGHVDNFSDPMIDNKDSNKRYRADHLIEGHLAYLGVATEEIAEHPMMVAFEKLLTENNFEGIKQLIVDNNICCPISKTCNWTDVRQFNLMFSTQVGSVAEESDTIYLRPETAQGIFVNFLNVQKTARLKIPFGIAQVGKAFRNEIVARGFIFRMREFEQMEMQFFVRPGTQKYWYEHWKQVRMQWHLDLGISANKYRFHDHLKLAHYADMACDIEYDFPMGFKEVEGIHSRTDFEEDLSTADKQDSRVVLKFPPKLAPIKLAILPLMKKDGLPEIAREIMKDCIDSFHCFYEEKDSIGKRYRRMDALGTPFCVTIDHDTKTDGMVTIRHRDSMLQERIKIEDVKSIVLKAL